jgi:hypothetical protein
LYLFSSPFWPVCSLPTLPLAPLLCLSFFLIHWSSQVLTWSGLHMFDHLLFCVHLTHHAHGGGSKHPENFGQLLQDSIAQYPRRLSSWQKNVV